MTAINAMKFNATEGGMVTDSQSSNQIRKYDFADKVESAQSNDGTMILFGGSGYADLLYEINSKLKDELAKCRDYDVETVARMLSGISGAVKRDKINAHLFSTFGIDTAKALSGEGIGQHLIPQVKDTLTGQGTIFFQGEYILVGKDNNKGNKDVKIYSICFGSSPILIARPYSSTGSGTDESDKVLYSFIKDQSRDGRKNISLLSGMAALIRATNASSEINPGVGGTPTIGYFDARGITILGEEESKLATEVVKVGDAQLITPNAAKKGLEALLSGTKSVDEVEQTTFKRTPQKYDSIMRFLRGYRV